LTVLRFWNHEVYKNLDGVLEMVLVRLDELYTEKELAADDNL